MTIATTTKKHEVNGENINGNSPGHVPEMQYEL